MGNRLSPPPLETPLLQKNGTHSPTWGRWLNQLQSALSGFTSPQAWKTIAWGANWSDTPGYTSRYRKDASGLVHFEIDVTAGGGATGTDIPFTFPEDFWPGQQINNPVVGPASMGFRYFIDTFGQFGIRADGGAFGAGAFKACGSFTAASAG